MKARAQDVGAIKERETMDEHAIDKAPDAAAEWPDQIYSLLKTHNITQVALVPDAGHSRLIRRCLADNEMKVVTLTTEEEGIALLQGAWLGGAKGVLLI
jgi:sulfopyruvate decarboxylase TPP-binding subunit